MEVLGGGAELLWKSYREKRKRAEFLWNSYREKRKWSGAPGGGVGNLGGGPERSGGPKE